MQKERPTGQVCGCGKGFVEVKCCGTWRCGDCHWRHQASHANIRVVSS
jgi:hypothetical protein